MCHRLVMGHSLLLICVSTVPSGEDLAIFSHVELEVSTGYQRGRLRLLSGWKETSMEWSGKFT